MVILKKKKLIIKKIKIYKFFFPYFIYNFILLLFLAIDNTS